MRLEETRHIINFLNPILCVLKQSFLASMYLFALHGSGGTQHGIHGVLTFPLSGDVLLLLQSHYVFRAELDHPLGSVVRVVTSSLIRFSAFWLTGFLVSFLSFQGTMALFPRSLVMFAWSLFCSFLSEPLPTISFDCVWHLPVLQPQD